MNTTEAFLKTVDNFTAETGISISELNEAANKHHGLLYRYRSGEAVPTAKTMDAYYKAMELLKYQKLSPHNTEKTVKNQGDKK